MSQRRAKQQRRADREQRPPRRGSSRRAVILASVAGAAIIAGAVGGGIVVAHGSSSAATPIGLTSASSSRPLTLSGQDPITGREVSLAAFRDKPIVLNVWGSWCTGCKAEARDLARFAATHWQAQVVGIDTQDTKDGARAFYRHYGWHHPSIFDPQGDIASQLGLQGTPTTFFLDRQHKVVAEIIGATTEAGFEQGLARALRT